MTTEKINSNHQIPKRFLKKSVYTAKPQKFRKNAKRQNAKIFFCGLCGVTTKTQRYYFAILRLRLCGFLRLCGVKSGFFRALPNTKSHRFVKSVIGHWLLFGYWLLFIGVLSGCQAREEKVKLEETIPVKVSRVEFREVDETIDYVGNIKAQDEAIVYPKVSGKIIEKVKQDGSPINKGEAIAYIDRDEVGLKFQKAPVESPLSGIIGRVYVDKGTNVTIQTPIALVVNMDKVKIDLDIPEKYLPLISLGQEAKIAVDAYPQEEFSGQVTKISPVLDLTIRAAPAEIAVDNPQHRLKSGMFAKVKLIIQKHKDIPVILKEAVMGKEPNLYVYVVDNKKAILRRITLGIRQGPYYEVLEGLKEGDLVVIVGQQRLYEGARVEPEEEKE